MRKLEVRLVPTESADFAHEGARVAQIEVPEGRLLIFDVPASGDIDDIRKGLRRALPASMWDRTLVLLRQAGESIEVYEIEDADATPPLATNIETK